MLVFIAALIFLQVNESVSIEFQNISHILVLICTRRFRGEQK